MITLTIDSLTANEPLPVREHKLEAMEETVSLD